MNRRDLIKLAVTTLALPSCVPWGSRSTSTAETTLETMYFGYNIEDADPKIGGAGFYDFKSKRQVELAQEIHSVSYSAAHNTKVYLPKLGLVSYYQRGDGELIPFSPAPGKYFYGHGVFDEKRGLFYSTQSTVLSPNQVDQMYDVGEIQVHSLEDFRIIGSFPSFGFNPHDVTIQGDELIVCNGGDKSNVAFIDLNTRKLIKSFDLPGEKHISFGHLDAVNAETFVVASGSRKASLPCPLYLVNKETGIRQFDLPEPLKPFFLGQLLSVLYHDGHAYATCPATGYVFVWTLEGEFLSALTVRNASTLVYSPKYQGVLAGSGNYDDPLRLLKVKGKIVMMKDIDALPVATGSHALLISQS